MHEYFELLTKVIHEHGFESYLEHPEHEVDTPRHYILTPRKKLGPITLWGGTKIAEIISEAYGGSAVDDREHVDPAETSLSYEGLRIHVLKPRYHAELVKMEEHLRKALKEPVSEE